MKNITPQQKQEAFDLLMPKVAPIVQAVRKLYKLTDRRFIKRDFFRICQAEKIEIADTAVFKFMTGCDEIQGCLMTLPDGGKAIYLKSFFEAELDLFTAGHELGHHFLGHKGGKPKEMLMRLMSDPIGQDIKELEADLFAELLTK